MSTPSIERAVVVYTRILPPMSPYTIVSFLHNHSAVIRLSPIISHYELKPKPDQPPGCHTYTIYQRIPLYPFGLVIKEIAFSATFQDTIHGLFTQLHAPMDLACEALYEVINVQEEHRKAGRENVLDAGGKVIQEGWILKETVKSRWNFEDKQVIMTRREMTRKMMEMIETQNLSKFAQPVG